MNQVEGKECSGLISEAVKKQVLLGFARLSLTVDFTSAELNVGYMLLPGRDHTLLTNGTFEFFGDLIG